MTNPQGDAQSTTIELDFHPAFDGYRDMFGSKYCDSGLWADRGPSFNWPEAWRSAMRRSNIQHGALAEDARPLTTREIIMLRVMDAITDKKDWQSKIYDEDICRKWRLEAIALGDVSEKMMDYSIAELRNKAAFFKKTGLVPTFDCDVAILKSDNLIREDERQLLLKHVNNFVSSSISGPHWHPGSKEQVHDIVHPSLYPLVYGRTRMLRTESIPRATAPAYIGAGNVISLPKYVGRIPRDYSERSNGANLWSTKYQLLPAEVRFADNGAHFTSYINNLHPKHEELYSSIERILDLVIPAWDRCIELASNPAQPRVTAEAPTYRLRREDESVGSSVEDEDDAEDSEEEQRRRRVLVDPEPEEYQTRQELNLNARISLASGYKAAGLQVIVKLSAIRLSPEQPRYSGGGWHLEGKLNDHILATALYYYDCDNTTDSFLEFRQSSSTVDLEELPYEQSEFEWIEKYYGIHNEGNGLQELGRVHTKQGRLLVFPNTLQHRVTPFELFDATKPGHRNFLVFWLVDPRRRIISTAKVPPQQKAWLDDQTLSSGTASVLHRLPLEIQRIISQYFDTITLKEAKDIQVDLMADRASAASGMESKLATYSFCEH